MPEAPRNDIAILKPTVIVMHRMHMITAVFSVSSGITSAETSPSLCLPNSRMSCSRKSAAVRMFDAST